MAVGSTWGVGVGSGFCSRAGVGVGPLASVDLSPSTSEEGVVDSSPSVVSPEFSSDRNGRPQPARISSNRNDQPSSSSLPGHLAFNIVTTPRYHSGLPSILRFNIVRPGVTKYIYIVRTSTTAGLPGPSGSSFSLGQQAKIRLIG